MMNQPLTTNPFGDGEKAGADSQVAFIESERAIQEAKAAMVVAKQFPRDQRVAMDRILNACTRPSLAREASYAYPRGGTMVTGPSIRLAEALAQNWGNIQFGIMELSQTRGESSVMAFAWDLETNTKQVKTFTVKHVRYTRTGVTQLEDPRDIYEHIASQGARRLRACLLGIIPRDVCEAAEQQCDVTLKNEMGAPAEEVEQMLEAFAKFKVTKEMIAKRLGHHLDATIAAEVIMLRKIYASLRDGMAKPADYFQGDDTAQADATALKDAAAAKRKSKQAKAAKAANAKEAQKVAAEGQAALGADELVAGLAAAESSDRIDELEDAGRDMAPADLEKVKGAAVDARIRLENSDETTWTKSP